MKKNLLIFFIIIGFISGCKKNCWKCTAIVEEVYLYTKGIDTITVFFIEGADVRYGDSLTDMGYSNQWIENRNIPTDFTFCNEGSDFHPYTNCFRTK